MSADMQDLLVKLLNKANVWVREAHESNHGFLPGMCLLLRVYKKWTTNCLFQNKDKKIIMLSVLTSNKAQKMHITQPKRKRERLDWLGNQQTQSHFYAQYGRKKAKIANRDSEYNLSNANDSIDDDFDTTDNKKSEPDEYKRLVKDFFEDLKIDLTSSNELRNKYNNFPAAKQENWSQDQFNLLALLCLEL